MRTIAILFAACIAYAFVRYVAFAPANLPHVPVFVVNKGVSMAAALCFALAFWQQWRRVRGAAGGVEPVAWFRAGLFGAVAHVPMSLAILRPGYFKEFFLADPAAGGRMTFNGEAVLLFGALTAGGLYLLARQQWTPAHRWWLSVGTVAALLAHTLCMGIARGLNINASHGYLPPMWLLSLIGTALGGAFLLRSRPPADATGGDEAGKLPGP